jgi:hypothetical protein
MRQVHATLTPAPGSLWVHVGDPLADMFPFFQACQATQLAFGQMTLLPPRYEPRASEEPLTVWVVRVWEEQAKDGRGAAGMGEAFLGSHHDARSSVGARGLVWADALLVEDYHQCLTSGCHIEQRQGPQLMAWYGGSGLLSPLAVRRYAGACLRS